MLGNNRYVLDADATYEFAIERYSDAFGAKFDLTKFDTYEHSKQFYDNHWKGKAALDFTKSDTRRSFVQHRLAKEKNTYTMYNMHGLVLDMSHTVLQSVGGAPSSSPPSHLILCCSYSGKTCCTGRRGRW